MQTTELPPKRRFPALKVLVLFLILAGLFAAYLHYFYNQRAGSAQVYDNLEVFGTRLQNLENTTLLHEKRLKDLEETTQKLASATPNVTPSAPAAPATPGDNAAAAATPPSAGNDDRIAALEKEITALKAASAAAPQDSEKIYQAIRMLSAFHRLSDKILSGKPFAAELTAFEDIARPDESSGSALATLAPYADSGIPTFATLLSAFDDSMDSLSAAQSLPPPNASLWERFKYNLMHLVSIRRIDDQQTGTSANAVVGRAQAHLEREEIEAAVAEIKSLPDVPRSNFAAWLDDAQMVTEAPSLVDQIEEQVMQKAFHADAPAAAPTPSPDHPAAPRT